MPNSTVPAASTGLPNLNRRLILSKLGLGMAASVPIAAMASPLPLPAAPSLELLRLIETCRAAAAVTEQAVAAREKAQAVYTASMKPVPAWLTAIAWKGRYIERDFREGISFNTKVGLDIVSDRGPLSDKLKRRMKSLEKAINGERHGYVDQLFAEREALKDSCGLTAAAQALERAIEAENTATLAVCDFRCLTLQEANLKASYLSEIGSRLNENHFEAAMQAATGAEA